jgi:hypothetical protein
VEHLTTALASATAKFYSSQLTALKSTNTKKLASIVIGNYVKKPKMTIFRHRKMHVRIELET